MTISRSTAPGKRRATAPHGGGRNLLRKPGEEFSAVLEQALAAAARAFPIPGSHRKDLPAAVRDLSRMLTSERGELARPYWAHPRYLSAYLRYFLPWNLYRLGWLIPGLDLALRPGAHILDLGSGPLTLPLALWCARPDLRTMPLSFTCTDTAAKPLETGRDILARLAGKDSPWKIFLERGPVEKTLRTTGSRKFDLITAGNVLNELCTRKNTPSNEPQRLDQYIGQLTSRLSRSLAPGGQVLLVEPGTRLGGKLISLTRQAALENNFEILAPCTHKQACPMLVPHEENATGEPADYRRAPVVSGWCHFILPAQGAPAALARVGAAAGLEKESLSLSCLFLQKAAGTHDAAAARATPGDELDDLEALYREIMEEDDAATESPMPRREPEPTASPEARLRVISSPIRLPDREEPARYACSERGTTLLLDALRTPSGAYVALPWPRTEEYDRKTGALLLERPVRVQSKK